MDIRIIGIDYGRKRVGLAVSDPLRIFASALETVPSAKIIDYLKTYSQNVQVERFVVGYPMNMNNKPSDIGLPTPVVTVERLELSTL